MNIYACLYLYLYVSRYPCIHPSIYQSLGRSLSAHVRQTKRAQLDNQVRKFDTSINIVMCRYRYIRMSTSISICIYIHVSIHLSISRLSARFLRTCDTPKHARLDNQVRNFDTSINIVICVDIGIYMHAYARSMRTCDTPKHARLDNQVRKFDTSTSIDTVTCVDIDIYACLRSLSAHVRHTKRARLDNQVRKFDMCRYARRTPRPCSVCGSPRLCRRRERRLIGARFGRWREERFGRARCLTLRYSLLLSVWVDPSAEHI